MKYCSFLLFCHIFVNFDRFNVVNIFCKCQSDLQYKDDDESERVFDEIRIVKKADPTYETSPYTMSVLNQSYHDQEEEEDRFFNESDEDNRDIIIYNFDAEINDNLDIVKKVYEMILKNYLGIHVTYKEIESVTKLGHDPTWKRPVIITFKTHDFKQEVLRKRQLFRCGNYKIETFIPREVMLEQKKFVDEAKRLRKEGKRVQLRDGKFIVDKVVKRNFYREYKERLKQREEILKNGNRPMTTRILNFTSVTIISNSSHNGTLEP
ncbi:uncharacterized protein LOC135848911 isoform X2 [Planococcus citri]|uniref:uncharacterized protein LOC135848911 isoform X2 n=1 Tax=Planococcus citri TaxID=170843 RepID=UPI0031F88E27